MRKPSADGFVTVTLIATAMAPDGGTGSRPATGITRVSPARSRPPPKPSRVSTNLVGVTGNKRLRRIGCSGRHSRTAHDHNAQKQRADRRQSEQPRTRLHVTPPVEQCVIIVCPRSAVKGLSDNAEQRKRLAQVVAAELLTQ